MAERTITSAARALIGMDEPVAKDAGGTQDAPSAVGRMRADLAPNVSITKLRRRTHARGARPVTRQQGRAGTPRQPSVPGPAAAAPAQDLAPLAAAIQKLAARPVVVQAPAVEQRPTRKIVKRDPNTDLILESIEVPVTDDEWAALKAGDGNAS